MLQRENHCNNYKVIVIRCYCNDEKVVASHYNKLRGNRFIQQKNRVAINPKYCNRQVDAITSLLQLGFLRGESWRELKEGTVQRKIPRPENQGKCDI